MQGLEAIEKRIKDECNRLFTPVQDFNDFKHRVNEDVIALFKRLQNAEKNIESNIHDIGMHKEQLEQLRKAFSDLKKNLGKQDHGGSRPSSSRSEHLGPEDQN
jgi:chromosome segregation ATPase